MLFQIVNLIWKKNPKISILQAIRSPIKNLQTVDRKELGENKISVKEQLKTVKNVVPKQEKSFSKEQKEVRIESIR